MRAPQSTPLSNRSARAQRKARKELVAELLESSEVTQSTGSIPVDEEFFQPMLNSTFRDVNSNERAELNPEQTGNFDVLLEAICISQGNRNGTHSDEEYPGSDTITSVGNLDVLWKAMLTSQPAFTTESGQTSNESDFNTASNSTSETVLLEEQGFESMDVFPSSSLAMETISLKDQDIESMVKAPKCGTISRLTDMIKKQRQTIRSLRAQVIIQELQRALIFLFYFFQLRTRDAQLKTYDKVTKSQKKQLDNLHEDNVCLRKACCEMGSVADCVINNRIRKAFSTLFTPNQIDLIMGVKKKVVWTNSEIAMAFALR